MRSTIQKMWNQSAPLMVFSVLMLLAFAACVIGIFADPRTITGAPAWLKPAKFAISGAIFTATFAWLFLFMPAWPRLTRAAGWIFTLVFTVEIAIIDIQAARGVPSHFNVGNKLDSTLFQIMGVSIGVLWLTSVVVCWALFRQPFQDRAWGWSLRLGMLIYVLGSAAGGFMVTPTAEQKQALAAHQPVQMIGGHTVGAPDGGEGIPAIGWSRHHGDLRAAHFFGMHALQILAFLGWLIARRRGGVSMVFAAAGSYLAFTAILVWQALRGQSILEPDSTTLIALAAWLAATIAAMMFFGRNYFSAAFVAKSSTNDGKIPNTSVAMADPNTAIFKVGPTAGSASDGSGSLKYITTSTRR